MMSNLTMLVSGMDFNPNHSILSGIVINSRGPALSEKIAVCIKTQQIVWVNGPFPTGDWSDLNIAQLGINHYLDDKECYVGDGVYYDGQQWAETPTGHNNNKQYINTLARVHHETANCHFKCFGCL